MRAAFLRLATVLASALIATSALAQQGLRLKPEDFSPWQARLQLNQSLDSASTSFDARLGSRLLSANILGDYYLTGSGLGSHTRGGLRATGGVLMGPLSLVQSSSGLALGRQASLGPYLSLGHRSLNLLMGPEREATVSASYLGLGYTSYSLRGGWGFSADLGLMAGNTPGLRLGNNQPLDDGQRYKPLLQLGVSYSY